MLISIITINFADQYSFDMKRVYICMIFLVSASLSLYAETPVVPPNYRDKSLIAPEYFGPNAFPVPIMLTGTNDSTLNFSLGLDAQFAQPGRTQKGNEGERTNTIQAYLSIPLFTQRVNFRVWMPVMEFYENTNFGSGHGAGDVYISTDIQILNERHIAPAIQLRAAMKTASGGQYEKYRFYDSPAYFFDIAFAKSFALNPDWLIRLCASAGFLCWQTDNGRQNDAVMYGVSMQLRYRYVSAVATYAGYVGWENAGDQPMVIRADLRGHVNNFEPFIGYEYGIKDYPFHTARLGLRYHIPILKK